MRIDVKPFIFGGLRDGDLHALEREISNDLPISFAEAELYSSIRESDVYPELELLFRSDDEHRNASIEIKILDWLSSKWPAYQEKLAIIIEDEFQAIYSVDRSYVYGSYNTKGGNFRSAILVASEDYHIEDIVKTGKHEEAHGFFDEHTSNGYRGATCLSGYDCVFTHPTSSNKFCPDCKTKLDGIARKVA